MSTKPQPEWREMSSELIDLGRDIAQIQNSLNKIVAIRTYGERNPREFLWEAKTAARHLIKSLEMLIYRIDTPE